MASLTPEQGYWRANYGVTDYPYLHQLFDEKQIVAAVRGRHKSGKEEDLTAEMAGDM